MSVCMIRASGPGRHLRVARGERFTLIDVPAAATSAAWVVAKAADSSLLQREKTWFNERS